MSACVLRVKQRKLLARQVARAPERSLTINNINASAMQGALRLKNLRYTAYPVVIASLQRGGVPLRSSSHLLRREASLKKRRCADAELLQKPHCLILRDG